MVKKNITLLLLFIFFSGKSLFSEIAILPYKINNPSVYFNNESGIEYSKLLSVGALYKKELEVSSPRDIETDLKRFGLSIERSITEDELNMLGRARFLDYILLGTLSKSGSNFISNSLLYSVKDNRVVFRIKAAAGNLIDLAEKEINEAFYQHRDAKKANAKTHLDLVFLIDSSYKMNYDWPKVKDSILRLSGTVIDSLKINTRIYIIPFSSKTAYNYGAVAVNSIIEISKIFKNIHPAGGMSPDNFFNSLRYSVESVKWRNDAGKMIVILTNSNIGSSGFNEKFGIIAGKKGIKINSVALGSLKGDDSEIIKRLSTISGGVYRDVSYHQKAFDVNGSGIELYLESSRFFRSRVYDSSWLDGILEKEKNRSGFGKPRNFLDEIFYDDKKHNVEPYSMTDLFTGITGERIINKEPLENNLHDILNFMVDTNFLKSGRFSYPLGKALLSDGKISFWVQVTDKGLLDFLYDRQRQGFKFPMGLTVREDPVNTYGITFTPAVYKISSDYIPEIIKADLEEIIKRKRYYLGNGFFHPPIWFVDVKVENIESLNKVRDIRE